MSRRGKRRSKRPGISPGSLVHVGSERKEAVTIHLIEYGPDEFRETDFESLADLVVPRRTEVTWLNLSGIHDVALVEQIGRLFDLHLLVLEDILNTSQRTKVEEYPDHLFVVLRMLQLNSANGEVEDEQISLILGDNYVLSFQEKPGDVFDPVRHRIRDGRGRIRRMKADYLAYSLLDAIVDHYFVVLDTVGEKTDRIEDDVFSQQSGEAVTDIYHLKREVAVLRRSIWPLREALATLSREDSPLLRPEVGVFIRDVYDHAVRVMDTVEAVRETLSSLLDLNISITGQRMNEVMQVLTVIATIFIPLTFLAGMYGMNFDNMPELHWPWAYPALWIVMLVLGVSMLFYFRSKKWL